MFNVLRPSFEVVKEDGFQEKSDIYKTNGGCLIVRGQPGAHPNQEVTTSKIVTFFLVPVWRQFGAKI